MSPFNQLTNNNLSKIVLFYHHFLETGDSVRASKLFDLFVKTENQQFALCFLGHYSAGKSSMVNELIGENILASSPIPTSENLVTLQQGTPGIKVFLKNGQHLSLKPPYDSGKIKAYAKNGEDVSRIDIYHDNVPKSLMYMDTPGIDSTDDAHMTATDNALHLSDAVLYVVDYNHVQSSTNFQYLKKLSEYNKPLYMIVNQIDKHNESEISLEDYKQQVENALHDWQINTQDIFFTSLKEKQLTDDLDSLKSLIRNTFANEEPNPKWLEDNLQLLIDEHMDWVKDTDKERIDTLEDQASPYTIQDIEDIEGKVSTLQEQVKKQNAKADLWFQEAKTKLKKVVESAILMPYETRELARLYLEANDPGFKVGFIFSKKKTDEERQHRLEDFHESLMKNVQTLEWHIKEELENICQTIEVNPGIIDQIHGINLKIESRELYSQQNEGARATGQYVLNYTNQLATLIQNRGMRDAQAILEAIQSEYKVTLKKELAKTTSELTHLSEIDEALKELKAIQNKLEQKENQLVTIKEQSFNDDESPELKQTYDQLMEKKAAYEDVNSNVVSLDETKDDTINQEQTLAETETPEDQEDSFFEESNNDGPTEYDETEIYNIQDQRTAFSNLFNKASQHLQDIRGFHRIEEQLKARANRLETGHFTIALFGAFSAGKSSFANALLGEAILPVSPHPTTATINQVLPVTEESPHGTVRVKLKSESILLDDLKNSSRQLNIDLESIEAIGGHLQKINHEQLKPEQQLHYSFLKNVHLGYPQMKEQLGTELIEDLKGSEKYIASESFACFVESVSIFYNCSLTQEGIVLVDTPGADSINARHTDVAFEYIKNADSLLYVSYYNHAFSRADQEFLRQLGRVKDTFTLDKMFFIVNAIDLADSEEEKNEVLDYVSGQLLTFGIRNPRLFGVSSLLSIYSERATHGQLTDTESESFSRLKTKKNLEQLSDHDIYKVSGMPSFRESWYNFTSHELLNTAIQSGKQEVLTAFNRLNQMIKNSHLEQDEKQQMVERFKESYQQCMEVVNNNATSHTLNSLGNQVTELFFYIKKRIMMRVYDEFKVYFNPSDLSVSKAQAHSHLEQSLKECIQFLSFDLDQELQATSLRIEAIVKKQLASLSDYFQTQIQQVEDGWELTLDIDYDMTEPPVTQHLVDVDIPNVRDIFKHFKSPKQFFEGNGQELMRESFEEKINAPIDDLLNNHESGFIGHYQETFTHLYENMTNEIKNQLSELYEADTDLLSNTDVNHRLEKALDELQQVMTQMNYLA